MPEQKTLAQRLHAFQADVEAIEKNKTNPHFKSRHFDINGLIGSIKPHLDKHGIIVIQPVKAYVRFEGKNVLETILINADNPEDKLESSMILPEETNPQKFGSMITYMRRYMLQSILLLEAEDDDGNSASSKVEVPQSIMANKKESVPAGDWQKKPASDKQKSMLHALRSQYGMPEDKFKEAFGITSTNDLNAGQMSKLIDRLKKKVDAGEKWEAPLPTINIDEEITDEEIVESLGFTKTQN